MRVNLGWVQDQDRSVTFRASRQDQEIIARLAVATERDISYILRRAIRLVTVEDLMRPLPIPEDGDGHS